MIWILHQFCIRSLVKRGQHLNCLKYSHENRIKIVFLRRMSRELRCLLRHVDVTLRNWNIKHQSACCMTNVWLTTCDMTYNLLLLRWSFSCYAAALRKVYISQIKCVQQIMERMNIIRAVQFFFFRFFGKCKICENCVWSLISFVEDMFYLGEKNVPLSWWKIKLRYLSIAPHLSCIFQAHSLFPLPPTTTHPP